VRNFDDKKRKRRTKERRPEGISATRPIGDALDRFIGGWSKAEERRLLKAIAIFETVDKTLWK